MFKVKMGRLSLGTCVGMCIVTAFIWAAWTQTHSSQSASPDPNSGGIVFPTGYLPTMPHPALKGSMVDLSAERLTGSDDPSSSAGLEFDSRNYALLTTGSGSERNPTSSGIPNSTTGSDPLRKLMQARPAARNQELLRAALVLYGSSFQSFFSSAFKKPEASSADENEAANPFTDAKQDTDKEASSSKASSSKPANSQTTAKTTNDPSPPQNTNAPSQGGGSSLPPVLFLGDWDGSGVLKAVSAFQIDDSNFLFSDGQRSFNFYLNPSAVEQQRSLAIEDINGDGIADLLVTGRNAPLGVVLLGDAASGFDFLYTFPTSFEPIVPIAGPYVNGMRQIVTVDMRSGEIDSFPFSGGNFANLANRMMLGFTPDYAGHLVDATSGIDYLMLGNIDQPAGTYQMLGDGTLQQTSQVLPSAPSTDMYQNFPGIGNVRVRCFQVGPYASIVVTNVAGETFNVANLKVMPGVFIAIGDLDSDGTIDVAVARPK